MGTLWRPFWPTVLKCRANALVKYGISIWDFNGKMKDWLTVARELAAKIEATGGIVSKSGIAVRSVGQAVSGIAVITPPATDAIKALGDTTRKAGEYAAAAGLGFAKSAYTLANLKKKYAETKEALEAIAAPTQADLNLSKKVNESYDELSKVGGNIWNKFFLSFGEYVTEANKAMTESLKTIRTNLSSR